jgi:hypothetical protein
VFVSIYVAPQSNDKSNVPFCADIAKATTSAGSVCVPVSASKAAHTLTDTHVIDEHLPFTGATGTTITPRLSVK